MSEVGIVDVSSQTVMGMRKTGKYEEIAAMFGRLFPFLVESGIRIAGPPVFVCHEMSAEEAMRADKEGNADIEVAVPVAGEVAGTDEIKRYELPGGKMAKTVHRGPYQDCGPTYESLFKWLEENGKQLTGPIREVYLNDPQEVPPAELLTEIYAPVD